MRWKLAMDRMVLQLHKLFGSILLCIIALLLVALLLLMNELNSSLRVKLDQSFRGGCDRIGYAVRNNETEDIYSRDFAEFLQSMDCIDASGTWGIYGNTRDFMHFLQQVQQKHVVIEGNATEESIESFLVSASGWDMFNLELLEGDPPDAFDLSVYDPVYLGYELRDLVEIGTVLGRDASAVYVVAGILKPGTLLPADELYMMGKFDISSAYSMDYEVVEVVSIPLSSFLYFSVKEGYTFAEAQEMIQQEAENRGWSVTVGALDAQLSSIEQSLKPVNRYMLQMVLVVGVTVCIVFTCYQTVSIIVRKSEYGILYANGASFRDLVAIVLIENLIKMLLSLIILMPLFALLAQEVFTLYYGDQYIIQWMIWEKVSWKVALTGAGMALLSSVFPIYILKRYSPVELIGGNIT